jgi:beta-xylosidase
VLRKAIAKAAPVILATQQLLSAQAIANPLFDGADPDLLLVGNTYWMYPTSAGSGSELFAYSSNDLSSWTRHGPVLELKNINWVNDDGAPEHFLWAPGPFALDGKYYLYYSVGPQNPTPSRIGVAVADSPEGPFRDLGKALITGGDGFEAIDPMVFKDPKSKKTYLYCGGSAGSRLRVYELVFQDGSLKSVVQKQVKNPENFTEGAFIHFYKGLYYLSYSHGRWNDDSYSVCYSTSKSALGPWNYKGCILSSDSKHAGPGHHAFFQNPADGQWYIVYHRWNDAVSSGKMPASRSIAIDKLEYAANGDLLQVKMTESLVSAGKQ